jgi:hypothetical protein
VKELVMVDKEMIPQQYIEMLYSNVSGGLLTDEYFVDPILIANWIVNEQIKIVGIVGNEDKHFEGANAEEAKNQIAFIKEDLKMILIALDANIETKEIREKIREKICDLQFVKEEFTGLYESHRQTQRINKSADTVLSDQSNGDEKLIPDDKEKTSNDSIRSDEIGSEVKEILNTSQCMEEKAYRLREMYKKHGHRNYNKLAALILFPQVTNSGTSTKQTNRLSDKWERKLKELNSGVPSSTKKVRAGTSRTTKDK